MRSRCRGGRVVPVSNGTRLTIVLEIESGSTPISGRLTEEERGSVEFGGWLGLASALERLLEQPLGAPPGADQRGDREQEKKS
jgi:hypothetical protein